ncbi:MAG: AgmX/PglI C-terminal domain-containing protein [Deltaproteobacteria bacterium]|nr:AgmX/PglI C-terminal domain-containing protein [Deltaproteobacteria bacterium]
MSVKRAEALQFEIRWNGRLLGLERLNPGASLSLAGTNMNVVDGGVVVDGVRRAFIGDEPLPLACGPLDVVVSAPRRLPAVRDSNVDVAWWRNASMALVLVLGAVFAMRLTPVMPSVDDGELVRGQMKAVVAAIVRPPPPKPPSTTIAAVKPSSPLRSRAIKPMTTADKRSRDLALAKQALAALGLPMGSATDGVFAKGMDVGVALRGLQAPGMANAGGFGVRPTGGGGDGKTLDIGVLSDGTRIGGDDDIALINRDKRPVVVDTGTVQYVGGLDREEIQRVINRAMGRLRYCYEKELNTHQDLEGKVTPQWTIGGTGDVMAASMMQTTMGNRNVDECVLRVIRQLKFPAPRGAGVVHVTYPFIFSAR